MTEIDEKLEEMRERAWHLSSCAAHRELLVMNCVTLPVLMYLYVALCEPAMVMQIIAGVVAVLSLGGLVYERIAIAKATDGFLLGGGLWLWTRGIYALAHRFYQKVKPENLPVMAMGTVMATCALLVPMTIFRPTARLPHYIVFWTGSLVLCYWSCFVDLLLEMAYEETHEYLQ